MRRIRRSVSFADAFEQLLAQGLPVFGYDVVADKKAKVEHTIRTFLVHHPVRPQDPVLDIYSYAVTDTPFVLLYDFDDDELRIHLIIHARADRRRVDLSRVVW